MRKNERNQHQYKEADQVHRSKWFVCLISPGIVILVFLLMAMVVLPIHEKKIYAMSKCGILFLCSTPTPRPMPSSTPTPRPTPSSTPTPRPVPQPTPGSTPVPRSTPSPVSTPHPVSSPMETTSKIAGANVAKIPTTSLQTPVPSPASTFTTKGGDASSQLSGSGFSFLSMMMVVVVIFLCLLFALGISLFVLRRVLLPPIDMKLPPSGALPWSRDRVPEPDKLRDLQV